MVDTLDALRQELDATGDPVLCLLIADVVEEHGVHVTCRMCSGSEDICSSCDGTRTVWQPGDGRGWRWLGENGKTPTKYVGGVETRWQWMGSTAHEHYSGSRMPDPIIRRSSERLMNEGRPDTRIAAYDAAERAVREALDAGELPAS